MKVINVAIGIAVFAVIAGVVVLVRGLQPSPDAIAEGKAYTVASNKMMSAMAGGNVTYTGNSDADFAMLLIPHLQGAIDVAAVEAQYGTDGKLKAIAQKIADAQTKPIEQMTDWRKAHAVPPATPDAVMVRALFGSANDKMMNGMMGGSMAHSGNADVDFAKLMIPHGQGAVDIANVELKYGTDPEMKALAQSIVTAQTAEIAELTAWVKATGH